MKVLFLTNIPSPYRVDFFNELGKLCDLTVLYELEFSSERNKKWQDSFAENFKEVYLKGVRLRPDGALCISIIKYLKKKEYDLVIVGGYSTPTAMLAIEYMKLKKIPFGLNTDGGMKKNDNNIIGKIKKHFIGSAEFWLSTSELTTEYLINYGAIKNKIYKYPFTSLKYNDLRTYEFDINKYEIKQNLGIKYEKIILSIGRFIPLKGFDILLKSCKLIDPNIGVYIIGDEPTDEYLKLKTNLGLENVHFINFKEKDELKKYYNSADLFVLPTRSEVWGLVINEAMASGLPIITTDSCVAGKELINSYENGFIVKTDDINVLAEKMNIIMNDNLLRYKMGKNNLVKIQDYNIENMAKRYYEIFKENIR